MINDKELTEYWKQAQGRQLPMASNATVQLANAALRSILPALYSIAWSLSRIALAMERSR